MEFKINGFSLSLILNCQANAYSDTEGFLIGGVVELCSDEIDDYSSEIKKQKLVYVVESIKSCWEFGSWYDNTCQVDEDKLNGILGDKKKRVLGWFKTRRHSSQIISFKEKILYFNLRKYFSIQDFSKIIDKNQKKQKFPFLFLLHTTNNSNFLTSYNLQCFATDEDGNTNSIIIRISNLNIASSIEYKVEEGILNPSVQAIVNASSDFMRNNEGVDKMLTLSNSLIDQIYKMKVDLKESEDEMEKEMLELQELRKQVREAKEKLKRVENSAPNDLTEQPKPTSSTPQKPQIPKTVLTPKKTLIQNAKIDNETKTGISSDNVKTYQLINIADD